VAAFGLSASIFSVLLYLVLYLQDILGYSPLGTGVRLMYLSGAILVSATVAGRLSSRAPVRLLIGPGLIIIGVSLLLMRGLHAGSTWTHLIPGMIVGGVGVGLVNPSLASTAVGVVPPQQAGMASGINSTFRQVGIATGIALLGTLFSHDMKDEVLTRTAAVPGLSARGPEIVGAVQSGQIGNVIARLPAPARQVVGTITRAAFTTGLNRILAGRGDHRVRGRRRIAGRYPQPGLRARSARRPRAVVLASEEFQQFRSECVRGHVVCLALKDAVGRGRDGSGGCLARVGDPCRAVPPCEHERGLGNGSQPVGG
jgi:MFS family permease